MNTSLFSESPLVGTFKFVAMYILFWYKLKFQLKKKKLHINPNQNSTKAIRVICDRKFKKYNTKKLNKKTINLNYSYKKEQKSRERERERERELTVFVWKKYGLNRINDIKFIQNKMERRRVKI